ncbi:MAG: gliding motility-associated C-terminal domain-containing protein [Bacteroidota bacterium]
MRKIIFIVCMFCLPKILGAQNLVPNGDFEYYTTCPITANEVYRAYPWFTPGGSSDYFNSCVVWPFVAVPTNQFGTQVPHSGNGYCGFLTIINFNPDSREYIAVGLKEPLKTNKKYCISFWVSAAELSHLGISNIGAYFSNDTIKQIPQGFNVLLPYSPQVENADYNFLSDTLSWMKVEGSFIAAGGERFMTIGNFRDDAHTLFDTIKPLPLGIPNETYYYIDDVSVYYCGEDTIPIEPIENMLEISNAFTPNNDGKNDYFHIKGTNISTVHLKIINRWGQQLYEGMGENVKWDGTYDGKEVSAGVYYYIAEVVFKDGEVRNKKGSIHLIQKK